jgi:hypothetical protein
MSFQRAFLFFAHGTALWAFLMLALFAQLHPPAIVAFLVAFFLSVFYRQLGLRFSGALWLILSILALVASLYGWFVLQEHLYSVVYLFLFLEINKLWTGERNRDYLHVFGLTFFQVLAASVSTASVLFAPALAFYMLLMLGALITITLKGDAELALAGATSRKGAVRGPVLRVASHEKQRLQGLYEGTYLTPLFCRRLGAFLAAVIAIGSGLFFVIPRLQAQYFLGGIPSSRNATLTTGFNDLVDFMGVEGIQTNPEIVMRAIPEIGYRLINGEPDLDVMRLRGTSLDFYDGRQWRKGAAAANSFMDLGLRRGVNFAESNQPSRGAYQTTITLEPNRSGYLFGPGRPLRYSFDSLVNLQVDTISESVQIRANNWSMPLRYVVESDPAEMGLDDEAPDVTRNERERLTKALDSVATASFFESLARLIRPTEFRSFLQLPDHPDIATVRELVIEWTGANDSPDQIAREIERRLRRDYTYSLDISFASQPDHLSEFLKREKRGHCEYFATAMALMLRARGVPARIVNGYASDEWVGSGGGYYIVRQEHAHSWVEAYLPGRGWTIFEPTPSAGIGANRIPDSLYRRVSRWLDTVKLLWYERVIDFNSSDQSGMYMLLFSFADVLPRLADALQGGITRLSPSGIGAGGATGRYLVIGVLSVAGILLLFLFREVVRVLREKRIPAGGKAQNGTRQASRVVPQYLDLLKAVENHRERPASETPLEFAHRVSVSSDSMQDFLPLTRTYYRARFNGSTWTPADTEKALVLLRKLSENPPQRTRSSGPLPSAASGLSTNGKEKNGN